MGLPEAWEPLADRTYTDIAERTVSPTDDCASNIGISLKRFALQLPQDETCSQLPITRVRPP